MRPVVVAEPQPLPYSDAADLSLRRSTQSAGVSEAAGKPAVITGAAVDQVVASYSDLPRVTASLRGQTQGVNP
jgi:hypothetical protein